MGFRGGARLLAFLAALVALGQWIVFVPLIAMGAVDADNVYTALLIAAFAGWPLLAVAAVAGGLLVDHRPRASVVLLLITGVGLLYPFAVGGLVGLAAAALAFASRKHAPAPERPGGWRKTWDVSRALAIGMAAVVVLVIIIPTVLSLVLRSRGSDSRPVTADQATPVVFSTADEALQDYAQSWEAPFIGKCLATGEAGTCVQSASESPDVVTYRLCAIRIETCQDVEVRQKADRWVVTTVGNPGKGP